MNMKTIQIFDEDYDRLVKLNSDVKFAVQELLDDSE